MWRTCQPVYLRRIEINIRVLLQISISFLYGRKFSIHPEMSDETALRLGRKNLGSNAKHKWLCSFGNDPSPLLSRFSHPYSSSSSRVFLWKWNGMMLVKHFAQCLMHKYPVNISYYPCYLKMEITCLPQGLQGIVCQLYFKKISEKKIFFK